MAYEGVELRVLIKIERFTQKEISLMESSRLGGSEAKECQVVR